MFVPFTAPSLSLTSSTGSLLVTGAKNRASHDTALRIVVAQGWSSAAMYVAICHPPEYFSSIRGVLLRGASHEHVGVMGVALCRVGGNPALALGSVCQSSDLAWHDVHDDFLHHARAMTHPPASANFAEPGLAVCGDGPLVEVVDIQDDTAQSQDVEGVPGQQGYGLRCIPAIPAVLFTDHDSQFGGSFRVVDIEQEAVPY